MKRTIINSFGFCGLLLIISCNQNALKNVDGKNIVEVSQKNKITAPIAPPANLDPNTNFETSVAGVRVNVNLDNDSLITDYLYRHPIQYLLKNDDVYISINNEIDFIFHSPGATDPNKYTDQSLGFHFYGHYMTTDAKYSLGEKKYDNSRVLHMFSQAGFTYQKDTKMDVTLFSDGAILMKVEDFKRFSRNFDSVAVHDDRKYWLFRPLWN